MKNSAPAGRSRTAKTDAAKPQERVMLTDEQQKTIEKEIGERAKRDLALHNLLEAVMRREPESDPDRRSGSQAPS